MDSDPQIENQYLRRQLQSLLAEARQNEEKMRRFDRLERRLIGTSSLAELIHLLLQEYKSAFDLDAVTLALVDPEYEIARILEGGTKGGAEAEGLILLESPVTLEALYGTATPFLGAFDVTRHGDLLQSSPCMTASVALLPLTRQGELIGSLNLGSCEEGRFTGDSGTDFLERLAAIVAICLENALNHERLKLVGLTDPLTGINNRRYFEHRCLEEITYARRHGLPLACMFLDVDKFKRINDTLGHQAGDEVLRRVAALIKSQLRASDILARYGGEEFVVLLPQSAPRVACDIAERIRASVAAQPFQPLPGESVPITISIGVSMLPGESPAKDAAALAGKLIASADEALYRAKESGRNRVVCA
jgi:two-component system, cell cycle response regulator